MRYFLKVLMLTILLASQAFAYPRFAAQYKQKCGLCHVNPTGGGMRDLYGSQYFAQTELPAHKIEPDKILKSAINDFISIGLDARTQYVYDENDNQSIYPYVPGGKLSTFFQMEGNFYLNAQLTDKLSILLEKGIYSEFEVYALGNFLPFDGYVKVGKFQPSFGWRLPDHTSFSRDVLGWFPYYFDTGIEAGIYPSDISANLGIFNGTSGQFDNDKGKALAARFEYRIPIRTAGIGIGGSFWHTDMEIDAIDMYGPLFYINLFKGRLVHLGEFDWRKTKNADTSAYVTTQNLSFMLKQGIWLEADYDFFDPNIHLKSGTINRYSLHLDYFPIGYVEIEPVYRYYDDGLLDRKYSQYLIQGHFFF